MTVWTVGVGATGVGRFLSMSIVLTNTSPPITRSTKTVARRDFNANYSCALFA